MRFHATKPERNAVLYTVDARSDVTPLQRLLIALVGVQVAAWIGCAVFLGTLL